jgi:sterol desaturase/sphingolipid hydroxylase (fatty acid hydroxylase superfamily)
VFLINILAFISLFLLWTLLVYLMHRLSHLKHKRNILRKIHFHHHNINYWQGDKIFKWYYLLFYFGSFYATLDILISLTLPALLVYLIYPPVGIYILLFHYLYEVFFSEGLLDHNPNIKGGITKVFAWGQYHLIHHKFLKFNFGLMITLWDYVFGTNKSDSNGL